MAVFGCSGENCTRYISISFIPGGNPVALSDPEKWARVYMRCKKCGSYYCDRCVEQMSNISQEPKCGKCGGELYTPSREEELKILL